MEPDSICYKELKQLFMGHQVYQADGQFDKRKLADYLFNNPNEREKLNQIVHPAVKQYVCSCYEDQKEKKELDLFILEAALLIEDHYDEICDELWYIYTSEENRRFRLKASRQYSDEKIDQMFRAQLPESIFRKYCKEEIDNNGSVENSCRQLDYILAQHGIRKRI